MTRCVVIAGLAFLVACSEKPDDLKTYRYPNAQGSAAVVVDVRNYGGAAGFVINDVSLEAAGQRIDRLRTLEHLSDAKIVWDDERHVRLCFVGSMDRGTARWSGEIDGVTYQIDFRDSGVDRTCG